MHYLLDIFSFPFSGNIYVLVIFIASTMNALSFGYFLVFPFLAIFMSLLSLLHRQRINYLLDIFLCFLFLAIFMSLLLHRQ